MTGTKISKPKISTDSIEADFYDMGEGVTALSTRRGSPEPDNPYSDFNACHYTGDNAAHVASCRERLCHVLGISSERLIIPRQTHSTVVAEVTSGNLQDDFSGVDALVTALPGVAIAVNTADCVPILLADPVNRVVAAVHSGWRGTVGEIVVSAVGRMVQMGAVADEIRAVTGPSICTGCFEVGYEVASQFEAKWHGQGVVSDEYLGVTGKYHVDLRRACRLSLEAAGIPSRNICDTSPCSRCAPSVYFSARKLGINSGRTLSVVMLDEK